MRKLFIHLLSFRLISPVVTGALAYLLILLINNNLSQIDDLFASQELYFCIALSFLLLELERLLLISTSAAIRRRLIGRLAIQVLAVVIVSFLLTTLMVHLYYNYLIGFSPSTGELSVFNIIYLVITLLYTALYFSHQLMYTINKSKLEAEVAKVKQAREDYARFIREVNPSLLFEGLEALLMQKTDSDRDPDELLDTLSVIYRYILNGMSKELVPYRKEIQALEHLTSFYRQTTGVHLKLEVEELTQGLVVPGTLLQIIQAYREITLGTQAEKLTVKIHNYKKDLVLEHIRNDRLAQKFSPDLIRELNESYRLYADRKIEIIETEKTRKILVPVIRHTYPENTI